MPLTFLCVCLAALAPPIAAGVAAANGPPVEVSPAVAAIPEVEFTIGATPELRDALGRYQVTVAGKPADGSTVSLWKWQRCEWTLPTPEPGGYVVVLHLASGSSRPGRFGYVSAGQEYVSAEFRDKGRYQGCIKAFRFSVPAGQTATHMVATGDGLYVFGVELSRVTREVQAPDGSLMELAPSSYRTVLRRPGQSDAAPACVVLVPPQAEAATAARALAAKFALAVRPEPALAQPLPAYPVAGLGIETNLVVLNLGRGGPLAQALRRAGLFEADEAIPGGGGYQIRVVPRPFRGTANLIVLAASDAAGLLRGIEAFEPHQDPTSQELVYDRFLAEVPSGRWAELRPSRYRTVADEKWWRTQRAALDLEFAGVKGDTPARSYISRTAEAGDRYWLTGDPRFAELFRLLLFKMQDEDIYGGDEGKDSHMALAPLLRAWDRCDEAAGFSNADRLRISNYLLLRCLEGNEGFARAYSQFREYSGPVRMRHNHQTILGCGLMQAYVYFWRLYDLPRAQRWKRWCDDLVANATAWGHAPEDSANYEPGTFLEVAEMLHDQGLSTQGVAGTERWPEVALRFLAGRDSFCLPAAYGDCWNVSDYRPFAFIGVMGEDWGWPATQTAVDRLIRGYRAVHPRSKPAGELFAYRHGSTEVGGLRPAPDAEAAAAALRPLLGLAPIPLSEGYHAYQTGAVGNAEMWARFPRPAAPAWARAADKIQYRSGFGTSDEYLLFETLGWANHGHMDLGAVVQYCQAGRLWIVDGGYENTDARHHSTLEVARDGHDAWGQLPGVKGRWGDFRAGPQMLEVIEQEPRHPGTPGRFSIHCRTRDLAGATWERLVSGGAGSGLRIEDRLTADEPGEYTATFRLRLLGAVTGGGGDWAARQRGVVLPIRLGLDPSDRVQPAPWEPDAHTWDQGRYPWYPFIENDGRPTTIAWTRKRRLERGETMALRAVLGPVQTEP